MGKESDGEAKVIVVMVIKNGVQVLWIDRL